MTKVTRIRFLACMNEFMSFHCTGIMELFFAKFTNHVECSGADISRFELSRIDWFWLKMPWSNLSRTKMSRLKTLSNSDFGCDFFKTFPNKCKQSTMIWKTKTQKTVLPQSAEPANFVIQSTRLGPVYYIYSQGLSLTYDY